MSKWNLKTFFKPKPKPKYFQLNRYPGAGGKKEKTERHKADETYVDHVRYLKGSGESERDEVTLPVGQLQVWSK